jgi:hypothetical protein
MNRLRLVAYAVVVFCILGWKQTDELKKISFYRDQVSVEVPGRWKYQEKFQKYSSRKIKYDAKICDKK